MNRPAPVLSLCCVGLLLSGCGPGAAAAAGGCAARVTVEGRSVLDPGSCEELFAGRGVPLQLRVGQTVLVTIHGVDGQRLHSSDPLTLAPVGDGGFRAASTGWSYIFFAARAGESCVQPPRPCNLLNVTVASSPSRLSSGPS